MTLQESFRKTAETSNANAHQTPVKGKYQFDYYLSRAAGLDITYSIEIKNV